MSRLYKLKRKRGNLQKKKRKKKKKGEQHQRSIIDEGEDGKNAHVTNETDKISGGLGEAVIRMVCIHVEKVLQ